MMEMAAEVKRRHPFESILFPFTFMALMIQPFSESQKNMYVNVQLLLSRAQLKNIQLKFTWPLLQLCWNDATFIHSP